MIFASPLMLWFLLVLVGPLIGFLWWAWRKKQEAITQFISSRLLAQLKVGVSPSRQKARLVMIVVAVVFVIFALARPQWGATREEVRQRGLDIMVAIDTSNSMLAEDVSPSRLARAKLAVLDLLHRARTDRMGLVAFAGTAFLQCPLTLDDAAFAQSVNGLDTKTISQGGTAIAEAIDEAAKAFKNESDNHRVLVLFTDGEDHDSDAVAAAEKAAKDGMIIFTIGIGTPQGELLRVRDEHGRLDYIRDEQGQPVKSKLDEDLLQQIARVTKGFYLPLRGTKTMDTLYDQGLAPLPKSEKDTKMFQTYREQFHWFLMVAIGLLILEMFLPERKRRRSKTSLAANSTEAAALAKAVVMFLLIVAPLSLRASPSSALREYNEGKYQEALKDYDKLLQNKQGDPRLHFNAGAAAYQSHELDQAAKEFGAALASPDLQLQQRAYYNLGNTLYRAGEQLQDAQKKQEAWENAIKNYESASKLNQQDADAHFNQDFVKRQLEELKKQQQKKQQQSQNSDKNQKQNKEDKNDQKQQDQKDKQDQKDAKGQSGDKQKQAQDQQNKDQSKSDGKSQADNKVKEKSDEQKKQDQQDRQDQQSAGQKDKDQQNQDQQQAQAQAGDKDKQQSVEDKQREAAMMAAGQMTPQQAKQLLDSEKNDERVFQLAPPNKNVSQGKSYKNW